MLDLAERSDDRTNRQILGLAHAVHVQPIGRSTLLLINIVAVTKLGRIMYVHRLFVVVARHFDGYLNSNTKPNWRNKMTEKAQRKTEKIEG